MSTLLHIDLITTYSWATTCPTKAILIHIVIEMVEMDID